MNQFKDTLITLDTTGKIRVVYLESEWNNDLQAYCIVRRSGCLGGKLVTAPTIVINRGKVKRTIHQQNELQYNSELKKYLDKGYKNIKDLEITDLTIENAKKALGSNKTGQDGVLKPMLAKKYQDVSIKLLENEWYCSRKINGVRCLIYWKDGEIKTSSRGATNYDIAIKHIITHPKLIELLKEHPNIILDGEVYKFGWTLNKISGLCRKQETDPEMEDLEFYMYDIVDTEKPFPARLNIINRIKESLNLGFDPNKTWTQDSLKIQIVPQDKIQGANNIKLKHDEFVSEGWEGLVIRDMVTPYKPGCRGPFMLKYKSYFDGEWLTVGLEEGMRREDFTFIMETPSGMRFNAKPIGSRELKEYYRAHLNEIIGKMATLKYFEMSGAGTDIPQQPIWIGIRDCE